MINEKSAETRQPPPTVDEIKSALDNLHSDESCRRLLFRLFRALQSDYALVSRADREKALLKNDAGVMLLSTEPARGRKKMAEARKLLHLPGPSDE